MLGLQYCVAICSLCVGIWLVARSGQLTSGWEAAIKHVFWTVSLVAALRIKGAIHNVCPAITVYISSNTVWEMGNTSTIKFLLTSLSRQNNTWLFRNILCICFQDKQGKIFVASDKYIFTSYYSWPNCKIINLMWWVWLWSTVLLKLTLKVQTKLHHMQTGNFKSHITLQFANRV